MSQEPCQPYGRCGRAKLGPRASRPLFEQRKGGRDARGPRFAHTFHPIEICITSETTFPASNLRDFCHMPTDHLDDFIAASARALALPVEPEWHPAIRANLEVTLRLAALVAEFRLPDDAEPAPVFRA